MVEEPQGYIIGSFGGLILLVREGAKGDENVGINGDGVIDDYSDYLLHKGGGLQGQ